jgi:hypothetical protein
MTGFQHWLWRITLSSIRRFLSAAVISDFVDLSSAKVSFLKLRTSWSRVSDGKIRALDDVLGKGYPYQHIQAYSPGVTWNNNPSLTFPATLVDPNIKPESSDSFEAGLDARFFQGRVGIDVAVYKIRDMITSCSSNVRSKRYDFRLLNGGEFSRKGLEITLTATPVKTNTFSWDVELTGANPTNISNRFMMEATRIGYIKTGTHAGIKFIAGLMHTPQVEN